ncbi:Polyamine-modulated factor 1/Kinetochore protein NNF1 [Phytophthora cactorum]|nr:Polyamine-modulated factor 1/Kinetochore protein NNF1 [Phytophthora cactorum]
MLHYPATILAYLVVWFVLKVSFIEEQQVRHEQHRQEDHQRCLQRIMIAIIQIYGSNAIGARVASAAGQAAPVRAHEAHETDSAEGTRRVSSHCVARGPARVSGERMSRGRGASSCIFPAIATATESPEHHNTEEVAAQAVLSLRQKVETLFEWLCETHDVDAELLELEDVIKQAEQRRLRQEEEKLQKQQEEKKQEEGEEQQEQDKTSPEARIRAERLRAKQEEQKELEALVEELEAKNKELQKVVEEKRRIATADVQRMQRAAIQLEEASHLAKDYATAP